MTDPKDLPYRISGRETIAETAGLRVQILTLAAGEKVPWHYHTTVTDTFVCMEGAMEVETRAPRSLHRLETGQTCAVAPMTAHEVRGAAGGPCRFTIIQGIGEHDFHLVGGDAHDPEAGE